MRAAAPILSSLLLAAALSSVSLPATAQALPPSGAGVSNSVNQSFQNQNQFRSLQQQQNFDTNTNRLQRSTDGMYRGAGSTGGYVVPRGARSGGRPERER